MLRVSEYILVSTAYDNWNTLKRFVLKDFFAFSRSQMTLNTYRLS